MRHTTLIASVIVMGALLSGCTFLGTVSGGGWVGTGANNAKVTFGIDLTCFGGTMSYIDRRPAKTVSVLITPSGSCDASFGGPGMHVVVDGTYSARPKGTGGIALVEFWDTGAQGPTKGDKVRVVLTNGLYGGYDSGVMTLDGGNVTVNTP